MFETLEAKLKSSQVCTYQVNVSIFKTKKKKRSFLLSLLKTKFNVPIELAQLSGIAAILRFPMPELEDEEDIDEENDTQDSDSDN